ncbi:unnamed protein product [Mytilus coruscus]|uniref:Endonuclease/exonuclease/phosphatase domain-containing protein n=1 Tax=Mytilus coruscus TaxID=42192 RepID=A0A6J8CNI0_MYTCO|nr:unnamed protein product [Mytilus coruscus]
MAATANAMTTQLATLQNDFTISGAHSAAHQALYGQGIHDSPYSPSTVPIQMQAPHPTPANVQTPFQPALLLQQLLFSQSPPMPFYERLDRFMVEVNEKLSKLNILDDLCNRMLNIESHCKSPDKDIGDIKSQFTSINSNRLAHVEYENQQISQENNALRERVVESQTRSMRDNLIFKGIADVENYNELENTEAKVKEFMGEVLKIKDNINFHVVHRLKPKTDGTPRSIVSKFERRKDRDRVLAIARDKLRENPRYSVYEQFPFEVADRRRQLIPILKDAEARTTMLSYGTINFTSTISGTTPIPLDRTTVMGQEVRGTVQEDNHAIVLPDYIIPDDNIIDILNLDEDNEILEYLFDYQNLLRNNIPLHRVSGCSCKPNNYGHRLLNLCKKLNIYIVNSRVGDDKGVGARTCKDISVVDYLILSSQLFPLLKKFAIAEFEPLFSDCHSALCFEFQASLLTHTRGKLDDLNDTNQTFVEWNTNRSSEFVNCIQTDSEAILADVLNSIENLSSCDEVRQSDIDVIVDKIVQNFHNAAIETFSKVKKRKKFKKTR